MNKGLLLITLAISLVGIILSFLLAEVGINVLINPGYHSFCNFNQEFNCETVALSSYASHFGIPNFLYGIGYYTLLLAVGGYCLTAKENKLPNYFVYVFWFSFIAILVSIYLFYVSEFIIKSKCVLCMMVYVVNIILFMVAFMAEKWSIKALITKLISDIKLYFSSAVRTVAFIIIAFTGIACLTYFNAHPILAQDIQTGEKIELDYSKTTADRLVTGPEEQPTITILEFTDYECPFCSRASMELKKVLKNNPDVRLIFKDYPLDQACNQNIPRPYHLNSCKASNYARCAAEQGKFWEYHDLLFENQNMHDEESLMQFAESLNLDMNQFKECAESNKHINKIITNIDEAIALGVEGTPTFYFQGRQVVGYKTAEEYQEIIDEIRAEIQKQKEEYEKKKAEFLKEQAEKQKEKIEETKNEQTQTQENKQPESKEETPEKNEDQSEE